VSHSPPFAVEADWIHIAYEEKALFTEVYGFSGSQGKVNVEGIRLRPKGVPAKTLAIYMHPASTLQLLPMPRAMAEAGVHVLCAASRFAKNDTPLTFEKVILDLGAYVRHAKEVLGYEKVVVCGWSGGGSLSLLYQAQAERPTLTETAAGDPVDIAGAKLIPADAMIFQAAHISRATMLEECIDPSVIDEHDPDTLRLEFDIFNPKCPNQPPYSPDFIAAYRAAQRDRIRRRSDYALETLRRVRLKGTQELERAFVTYRTMADLRFWDPAVDPNDRKPRWCFIGHPEAANTGPAGLGRFATCRAWLSQWSPEHTQADGLRSAAQVSVPFLAIENSADDGVPQPHTRRIFDAAASRDKTFHVIKGATHYYQGQPQLLKEAVDTCLGWMDARRLLG
jgi:pimeloyl-ACP methyl ester carboxylesterase